MNFFARTGDANQRRNFIGGGVIVIVEEQAAAFFMDNALAPFGVAPTVAEKFFLFGLSSGRK